MLFATNPAGQRHGCLFAWACFLTLIPTAAFGQPPRAAYVYPPVISRGENRVVLGGYDLTRDAEYFLLERSGASDVRLQTTGTPGPFLVPPPPYWFGPRASTPALPISREVPARIDVSATAPTGLWKWQVANCNGASAPARFYVSDTPEVVEKRLHPDEVQPLPSLPVGVSGRLSRIAEVDRYRIESPADGLLTIDVLARRLGADFHPVVKVFDGDGKQLVDRADTLGWDTAITFAVRARQAYTIHIHDADFRGHRAFVYRLGLQLGPRVVATQPARLQRGKKTRVTFIGYGLKSGDATLETMEQDVTVPATSAHSSRMFSLQTARGACKVRLPLSDLPEWSGPETAVREGDHAVTSRLKPERPVGRHRWRAKAGSLYRIVAQSFAIGGNMDVRLTLHDAKGKQLAANDDFNGSADAGIVAFKVPADGIYECRVAAAEAVFEKLQSIYRLEVRQHQPGFALQVPQTIAAPLGGKATVKISATRFAGFQGAVALRVEGLPGGVRPIGKWTIPSGKTSGSVVLEVDAKAPTAATHLRIVGEGKVGEQTQTHVARGPTPGNLCARDPADETTDRILFTITHKAPIAVKLVDKNRQRAVHAGTTYPAEFVIERDKGFQGPVHLQMASQQGRHRRGIRGPILVVPADKSRALYPCTMPEWLQSDLTTRMVVVGVAPWVDSAGKTRYLMCNSDARITMILEGALLKIAERTGELTVAPGEAFAPRFNVLRSAKLQVPVRVELVAPAALKEALQAKPKVLAPGQSRGELQVRSLRDARLRGTWKLQLRATAMQDGRWPVVSVTEFEVRFRR